MQISRNAGNILGNSLLVSKIVKTLTFDNAQAENWTENNSLKMALMQYPLTKKTNCLKKRRNMGYETFMRYHISVYTENILFSINVEGYELRSGPTKICLFSLLDLKLAP